MTSCLAVRSAWKHLSELMAPLRFCQRMRSQMGHPQQKRLFLSLVGLLQLQHACVMWFSDCRMRILLSFQIPQISKHQNQALTVSMRCDFRAKNPRAALTICPLLSILAGTSRARCLRLPHWLIGKSYSLPNQLKWQTCNKLHVTNISKW